MQTTFKLHWLRESSPAHLESDLGTAVPADQLELAMVGLLPEQQNGKHLSYFTIQDVTRCIGTDPKTAPRYPDWAHNRIQSFYDGPPSAANHAILCQFCNRIRTAADGLEHADLFLPYWNRRSWLDKFERMPSMDLSLNGAELRVAGVDPYTAEYLAFEMAASAYAQRPPDRILYSRVNVPVTPPWRRQLFARYGIDAPAGVAISQFDFTMPARLLAQLVDTPRERHCHYYMVFSRAAWAVQAALRRWVLAAYLGSPTRRSAADDLLDVLIYCAVRPHCEKRKRQFSYDVLDGELMTAAFEKSVRRLELLLHAVIVSKVPAIRNKQEAFRRGATQVARHEIGRAWRRKRLRAMLVAEGAIVDSIMRFANRIKSQESSQDVTTNARALAGDIRERLRRIFFFENVSDQFAPLILFEAAEAVHSVRGEGQSLQITATDASGLVYCNRRHVTDTPAAL